MSYAKGMGQVDYEERIDFSKLRKQRVQKTVDQLKANDLDAVLLWREENVRYLSSLRVQLLQYRGPNYHAVLLTSKGDLVLFVSGGEIARVKETMPWIENVQPISMLEESTQVEYFASNVLRSAFKDLGLSNGKVGIDAMTFNLLDGYQKNLGGVTIKDGNKPLFDARVTKTAEEIKLIEQATALAEVVTQRGMDSIAPGVTEYGVVAEVLHRLFSLGGEFAHVAVPFVASGERMSPPTRFASDKMIRSGDLVFIDIGASWNGYFGDLGRTTICGTPSRKQKEIYTAVYEAQMEGIKKMRAGTTNDEVALAYKGIAAQHGFENNFIYLFIGHGVGVSPNEPPYIGEPIPGAKKVELKPGMVFAMEPLIWVPNTQGGGGVRIEDMVLITENGPRVMSRIPYEERLLLN
ncbi:MAG: M24 family metallopeptidase [Nitrososphaerales archaeon]